MHSRLFAATLLILAANANSAPPAAWSDRNCASCHGSANLQTWPTGFLSGLSAGNLVSRLNAQTSSPSMPGLANDATPSGVADRASILQYLIDVRDGRISTNSLAFDAVTIDALTGNTRTVTITNERSRPMAYTLPVISPGNNGFSVIAESCTPRSVPATGSCSLTVRFLPTSATSTTFETMLRTATLSFSLSGTGGDPNPGLKSILLSGTALTPLEVSSGPLSFTADAGATSGTQTVAITNRLNANLLLCLEGPGASYFRIGSADLGSCTPLTSPGTSPNGTVTFSPGDGESLPRLATLTVRRGTAVGTVPPERSVALEGNAGPFLTRQGTGLINNTLFSERHQDVNAGATVPPEVVTLTNQGNETLRFSSVSIPLVSGAAGVEYTAGGCGTVLNVGASCDLLVTFDPSESGVRSTQLRIAYADLVNSVSSRRTVAVDLLGRGTRGASLVVRNAIGAEIATGSTESFGNQNINIAYRRKITLSNIGSDERLQVLVPSLLPGSAGFNLVAPTASPTTPCTSLTAGFNLAPGGSCTADILFQPSAVTGYASNLTLATRPEGAATAPFNFVLSLSGDGVDGRPALAWQTPVGDSVALIEVPGITAVGSPTPPSVRLHLVNPGPGAAALQVLNIVGPDAASFSINSAAPGRCEMGAAGSLLLEGASCEVVIAFRPQTAGAKSARLQLVSTGTTPVPIEIRAQGSGPALAIGLTATPASMSLADTRIGAQSAPATVVLSNSGMVSAVVIALDTSPGFAVDTGSCGAPPFSMAPNSSCTLSVRFLPSSAGVSRGRLSVQISGLAAPVEVALEGTGAEATDVSGGGCSITSGQQRIDPTLWALLLAAGASLVCRRKRQSRTNLKRMAGYTGNSADQQG